MRFWLTQRRKVAKTVREDVLARASGLVAGTVWMLVVSIALI